MLVDTALSLLPYVLILGILACAVRIGNVIRYIPNDHVGVVEKIFSRRGSVTSGFIALNNEAGFQPEVMRGGVHFFFPFVYRVHLHPLVTISQGYLGYIFARDGLPLEPSQTLAENSDDESFQDARGFIIGGGQKGPQRRVLREGTHAINLAQFLVITQDEVYGVHLDDVEAAALVQMQSIIAQRNGFTPIVIRDIEDKIGVVTVHDGPSLPPGEIIAPIVGDHNNFQLPERFIAAGGQRGRQLQVLVEGTYFVNRLFATVEIIPKEIVDIGWVGVVISYTGQRGADTSGEQYHHGELVETGHRGVWRDPLLPGKYAFNTYAGHIIRVPTTNFVLKWVQNAAGAYKFDENLSEISLITKDAFEPVLPLSVVLHIHYQRAPELIQRFGDVKRLVEATLDPMVSSYFKNLGQQKTLIQLLQQRGEIQETATADMKERFAAYTLEFQEVLIGTPRPPENDSTIETILIQLRQRQVAVEQQETFRVQQEAATKQRTLREAIAAAEMQSALTQSDINIRIAENTGSAQLAQAQKDAERIKVTAAAEANRIFATGEATAQAAKLQVDAYGGPEFRLSQEIAKAFFTALEQGHQPVVPQVLVNGGGSDTGGSLGALLSGLLSASLLKRESNVVPFQAAE